MKLHYSIPISGCFSLSVQRIEHTISVTTSPSLVQKCFKPSWLVSKPGDLCPAAQILSILQDHLQSTIPFGYRPNFCLNLMHLQHVTTLLHVGEACHMQPGTRHHLPARFYLAIFSSPLPFRFLSLSFLIPQVRLMFFHGLFHRLSHLVPNRCFL